MNSPGTSRLDAEGPCADLRRESTDACASVPAVRAVAAAAAGRLGHAQARLRAAEGALSAAQQQADPRLNGEAKGQAQRVYRRAMTTAAGSADERAAITAWMREIDRLNRETRSARAALEAARLEVAEAHGEVAASSQAANMERIRAEGAADRCQAARQRLAACEEALAGSARTDDGDGLDDPDDAEVPDLLDDGDEQPERPPRTLVIESLVRGDRPLLGAIAARTAEQTGIEQSTWVLLLQEMIEAIAERAAQEGFLDFESHHPFWGQFSREEARSLVRALAGVGARVDGHGVWVGGRRPSQAEFAMALAHAGYDARGVRGLPSGDAVGSLFDGARVAAGELLATRAPSLALEEMDALLGDRAERLGELWDHWGHLRPQLLADASD